MIFTKSFETGLHKTSSSDSTVAAQFKITVNIDYDNSTIKTDVYGKIDSTSTNSFRNIRGFYAIFFKNEPTSNNAESADNIIGKIFSTNFDISKLSPIIELHGNANRDYTLIYSSGNNINNLNYLSGVNLNSLNGNFYVQFGVNVGGLNDAANDRFYTHSYNDADYLRAYVNRPFTNSNQKQAVYRRDNDNLANYGTINISPITAPTIKDIEMDLSDAANPKLRIKAELGNDSGNANIYPQYSEGDYIHIYVSNKQNIVPATGTGDNVNGYAPQSIVVTGSAGNRDGYVIISIDLTNQAGNTVINDVDFSQPLYARPFGLVAMPEINAEGNHVGGSIYGEEIRVNVPAALTQAKGYNGSNNTFNLPWARRGVSIGNIDIDDYLGHKSENSGYTYLIYYNYLNKDGTAGQKIVGSHTTTLNSLLSTINVDGIATGDLYWLPKYKLNDNQYTEGSGYYIDNRTHNVSGMNRKIYNKYFYDGSVQPELIIDTFYNGNLVTSTTMNGISYDNSQMYGEMGYRVKVYQNVGDIKTISGNSAVACTPHIVQKNSSGNLILKQASNTDLSLKSIFVVKTDDNDNKKAVLLNND